MRTWELTRDAWYDYARALDSEDGWPNGLSGDPVRVIELEPVLDLLERLIGEDVLCLPDDQQNDPEAMGTALLRTHGRLDG